jgi:PIN domain nuclease of toxin-antitoxin system
LILVDTHVLVWIAAAPDKLSAKARAAIDEARKTGKGLGISDISLFEISVLASKGRVDPSVVSLESYLEEIESRFAVFPITGRACARAAQLPRTYPKDPADRIIGATALVAGIPLLTADRAIRRSKALPTIW